jgi:hypothetical protein
MSQRNINSVESAKSNEPEPPDMPKGKQISKIKKKQNQSRWRMQCQIERSLSEATF